MARSKNTLTRVALPFALVASLGVSSMAWAQEPSAADKETARALLIDGRAKRDARDFEGALKSLKAAHAIMHVPVTGLDYALALEATGQLVEARALALDITRIPEKAGEPDAFREARARGAEFAAKLESRIPAVLVTLKGMPREVESKVTLDGNPVPAAALGLPRKANPGAHTLKVAAPGFSPYEKKFDLKEGAPPLTIEAVLTPDGSAMVPVASTTPDAAPTGPRHPPAWAWVMGGIGIVGIGVGLGFAGAYAKVKSTVSTDCPNDACTPANFAKANALKSDWNRDLGVMGAGLGVGVVTLIVGIAGIASAPRSEAPKPAAAFAPWFAPGMGGVAAKGAF